jgi:hypothetical protein
LSIGHLLELTASLLVLLVLLPSPVFISSELHSPPHPPQKCIARGCRATHSLPVNLPAQILGGWGGGGHGPGTSHFFDFRLPPLHFVWRFPLFTHIHTISIFLSFPLSCCLDFSGSPRSFQHKDIVPVYVLVLQYGT